MQAEGGQMVVMISDSGAINARFYDTSYVWRNTATPRQSSTRKDVTLTIVDKLQKKPENKIL